MHHAVRPALFDGIHAQVHGSIRIKCLSGDELVIVRIHPDSRINLPPKLTGNHPVERRVSGYDRAKCLACVGGDKGSCVWQSANAFPNVFDAFGGVAWQWGAVLVHCQNGCYNARFHSVADQCAQCGASVFEASGWGHCKQYDHK